jgi:hypothetical protein
MHPALGVDSDLAGASAIERPFAGTVLPALVRPNGTQFRALADGFTRLPARPVFVSP